MIDEARALLRWVPTPQMFRWSFEAVRKVGITQAIRGNTALSDVIDTTRAEAGNPYSPRKFAKPLDIRTNVIESLSLAYTALYVKQVSNNSDEYVIAVEEEDLRKGGHHEEDLGDGQIMSVRNGLPGPCTAVQETKAVGLFGNDKRSIEEIAIEVIDKKLKKREDYPDFCTLVVSILPRASGINYRQIVEACDITTYDQVFALEYVGNDLRTCAVYDLLALKRGERGIYAPIMTPQLVYST